MKTVWTDRSRVETYQRCARLRWLEYHQDETGVVPAKKPLALCVGGSVHEGLRSLLTDAMTGRLSGSLLSLPLCEDTAVVAALDDFSQHKSALALDLSEATAMATVDPGSLHAQMIATAGELGIPLDDPSLVALQEQQGKAAAEFDQWLYAEQSALVEGMVRAYSRRRLRPLLEEFEVLEVEREGQWVLAEWDEEYTGYRQNIPPGTPAPYDYQVRFMSRPDALLRSRQDNSLYILSFKTAATWDIRKARDAEHDMQGLSEGVEVEKRLGEWWELIHNRVMPQEGNPPGDAPSQAMFDYLHDLPAPPRIMGIRYEYMLKGYRSEDKDLSARFGIKVWSQRSHLIQRYVATSVPSRGAAMYAMGDECWSYDYIKEDGSASKLAWQNWRRQPVWEHGSTIKSWIDKLDSTEMALSAYDPTVGQEPREVGWKSDAQALGYTATHPLDEVFPAPLTVYRSDDQLRDWVEQVEAQERRVAEAVATVAAAEDEGERRHQLNVLFPMSRRACSYPTECAMTKVCYGGDDIRRDPLGSGLYKRREPNHPQELTTTIKETPQC